MRIEKLSDIIINICCHISYFDLLDKLNKYIKIHANLHVHQILIEPQYCLMPFV